MGDKIRKGMIIKNTDTESVGIEMSTRRIEIGPGDQHFITAEEVRDAVLRESLQVRAITIVRPASMKETDEGHMLPEEERFYEWELEEEE